MYRDRWSKRSRILSTASRSIDPPDRLLEVAGTEPSERRGFGRRRHELPHVVVGAEHQRHQRRASPEACEVQPERVHAFGLHAFMPEDPSVEERLRRDLADDAGLLVIRRTEPVHVQRRLREHLEEVGVEQPPERRDVRLVQRVRIDLLAVRRVLRRPGHVQPRVRTLREDLRSLLTGQGIVHRGHDVLRPFGSDDPCGEGNERAHPAVSRPVESRKADMNPTKASTPSSVIAL